MKKRKIVAIIFLTVIIITIAFYFSFSWLRFGINHITVVGGIINVLLFCEMVLVYYEKIIRWRKGGEK